MNKHWRDLLNVGGIVLGVGLSVASLVRSWWVAGPLIIVGIGLLVTCTWLLARDRFRPGPLSGLFQTFAFGEYSTRWASSTTDVDHASQFLAALIRHSPPQATVLHAVHQRNPECIKLIEKQTNSVPELVGVIILVPLTRACVAGIESRRLRKVEDADISRHVSATWRSPAALYVGGVAGSSRQSRIWALTMTEVLIAAAGPLALYTRPTTSDGRRVSAKVGFVEIGEPSELWRK
ncbi:hypothetical protein ACFYO7_07535 [Nocardia salmonicida]|uniref:hypothetical protein n=1 Tax=Nocardia salmonicida TaxID=53431 RepID=UPI003687690A